MTKKKVMITGILGNIGSVLARQYVEDGWDVYGVIRRSSLMKLDRIESFKDKITLCYSDVADAPSIINLINEIRPDRLMSLAAQSDVAISFKTPASTFESIANSTLYMLEAIRSSPELREKTRFYNSSSSEIYGASPPPQNESTPLKPLSPYAVAKCAAHMLVQNYRVAYGLHCSNGICFNMETNQRGENFLTRKVSRAVARIKLGLQTELRLGPLDTYRDWIWGEDAARMMRMIVEQDKSDDFVIGSGESHSVQEWVETAFNYVGLDYKQYVVFDPSFVRPSDVPHLRSDATKAREKLGWYPTMRFKQLVEHMVQYDLENCARESTNMRVSRQSMGGSFGG